VTEEEAALQEEIRNLIKNWLFVCNVRSAEIKLHWCRGPEKDRSSCSVDSEYDVIHFEFNIGRILGELSTEELFEETCHEVAHVLTWPLWKVSDQLLRRAAHDGMSEAEINKWKEDIREAGEQSTTFVHRAIMRAYECAQERKAD
jgi:hypothetical protein